MYVGLASYSLWRGFISKQHITHKSVTLSIMNKVTSQTKSTRKIVQGWKTNSGTQYISIHLYTSMYSLSSIYVCLCMYTKTMYYVYTSKYVTVYIYIYIYLCMCEHTCYIYILYTHSLHKAVLTHISTHSIMSCMNLGFRLLRFSQCRTASVMVHEACAVPK